MTNDPIVEEVRKVRRQIEADCKKKGVSVFEYYRELQKQYADRLVNRGPQLLYRSADKNTTRKVAEPSRMWTAPKKAKRGHAPKNK